MNPIDERGPGTPRGRAGHARAVGLGLLALIAAAGGLLAAGVIPRKRLQAELEREAAEARDRVPAVRVAPVRRAAAEETLVLPGTARALLETPLYARTSGYLKKYHADIGDPVKQGQLVAEIDSPEVDQQLRQARANLAVSQASLRQVEANRALAKIAADRWATAVKEHTVSQQEADEKQAAFRAREADVQAAQAAIQASEANVKRLEELQGFEKIVAPFDGVLTYRNVDVGTLVSEGSSASARELFRVAQVDSLRIFVHVPEASLASIRNGQAADIAFDAHPNRKFKGEVSRSAQAVDPASRTMLTEVRVPNPDRFLKPGMYAQVTFRLQRPEPPLLMPSSALILRSEGTLVAVVGKDGAVHYQSVQVGRDYGMRIEILSGLKEGDAVMTSPSTDFHEGQKVEPVLEKEKDKGKGKK